MGGTWWVGTRMVAARSITEGGRSRAFRITTLLLLAVALAAVFLPRILGGGPTTYTLATDGTAPVAVRAQLDAAAEGADFEVEYLELADGPAVEDAVRQGDATVGVADEVMYVRSDAPGAFPVLVAQALVAEETALRLAAAGLSPGEIAELAAITPPEQVEVGPAQDEGRAGVGFVVGIVLYLAITFSGNLIATNVAVEKSTRIAEVLLAVLRPSQILVGNVIGIGVMTFTQLLVLAVPVTLGLAAGDSLDLPAVAAADIGLAVAWFVLGYFIYAFLFAATAALVDKVTDVASATLPVSALLIVGYLGAVIVVAQNPSSALSVTLSMFPLSSPMAMPIRWASGTVPAWQLVISMELAVAAAVLLAWFGSRVYRRALVVTGRRLKLREALSVENA